MILASDCYAVAIRLPALERFGLASQMRRSAVSVPSNIAEGHGRRQTREFIRYINIANGSLRELETQVMLARRLHRTDARLIATALSESARVGQMLRSLHRSLESKL